MLISKHMDLLRVSAKQPTVMLSEPGWVGAAFEPAPFGFVVDLGAEDTTRNTPTPRDNRIL